MREADEIAIFVRTVDLGTFAAVAQESGRTASAVARIVSRLELRLGVKLLHRTTRRLVLTQEGEVYLRHARAIVAAIEAAEAEVSAGAGRPRGLIRVNAGTAICKHRLVGAIPQFLAQYPDISIDLTVGDHRIDPITEQTDVTLRVGPLQDSELIMQRLGTVQRVIVASPDYLKRHGVPQVPSELLQHNCLLLSGFTRLAQWPMSEGGKRVEVPVKGSVTCDSADVLLDLALAGVGIVRLGDFLGEQAIAQGRLIPLLTDCHNTDPTAISALILPGRQHIPRVRAFLSFLKSLCS